VSSGRQECCELDDIPKNKVKRNTVWINILIRPERKKKKKTVRNFKGIPRRRENTRNNKYMYDITIYIEIILVTKNKRKLMKNVNQHFGKSTSESNLTSQS